MDKHELTLDQITEYGLSLRREEKAEGTIEKYQRDLKAFLRWLNGRVATKDLAHAWKQALQDQGYTPITINSMLAALNGLFRFLGCGSFQTKLLKIQRRLFRDERRELTRPEYERLLETAHSLGQERLALVMETICGTGIRVSEVRYITVAAAQQGKAEIALKGKIRVILLPGKLRRKLLRYARKEKIASGEIFITRGGKSLGRRQIWAEMKQLCRVAGIDPSKVFPHNLRHLFARTFYRTCRDLARLADVLGHSSTETTRLYLISTGAEHMKTLDHLHLVL